MKVVTISSWLICTIPRPRERGLRWGEIFGSALLQPVRSVCVTSECFFMVVCRWIDCFVLLTVFATITSATLYWVNSPVISRVLSVATAAVGATTVQNRSATDMCTDCCYHHSRCCHLDLATASVAQGSPHPSPPSVPQDSRLQQSHTRAQQLPQQSKVKPRMTLSTVHASATAADFTKLLLRNKC